MATTKELEKRINTILFDLSKGMDKDEVAQKYGYATFETLSTVLNRHGYRWDKGKKNFVKQPSIINEDMRMQMKPRGKVGEVIQRFEKEKDARKIAKELSFKTHRDMANYMAEKGYTWDSTKQNYVLETGYEPEPQTTVEYEPVTVDVNDVPSSEGLNPEYLEILQFLQLKRDKLYEILLEGEIARTFPNYIIPGKTFTKSIQITEGLDQLLKAYSEEKNVPQKNIVQVALVEFFNKYGYEHEIEALFGK
ncbi:hypothetical protein LC040_15585 [Bacillus tianshenii]|nr:hypothetical protein LC040_15585 [Bacillus tianshenii]